MPAFIKLSSSIDTYISGVMYACTRLQLSHKYISTAMSLFLTSDDQSSCNTDASHTLT